MIGAYDIGVRDGKAIQTEGTGLLFTLYIFFSKREIMPDILFATSFHINTSHSGVTAAEYGSATV